MMLVRGVSHTKVGRECKDSPAGSPAGSHQQTIKTAN